MRGRPAKVIQELAGHADLKTTMRYMHLSPHGIDSMIRVLEDGAGVEQVPARGQS
jgi:site-specific recombinase XerD